MAEQTQVDHITEDKWLEELKGIRHEVAIPGYWETLESNCAQWAPEVTVCPFWQGASERLKSWIGEYRSMTGGSLFAQQGLPKFDGKKAKRIRSKLYQYRLKDKDFRRKAFSQDGSSIPALNDLVRTRISCLYVDGVEFLANKLEQLTKEMKLSLTGSPHTPEKEGWRATLHNK